MLRKEEWDGNIKDQQFTVAKQRTKFQVQPRKADEVVATKRDFIVGFALDSNGEPRYHPEVGFTTRLPTSTWPTDHCMVQVNFVFRGR